MNPQLDWLNNQIDRMQAGKSLQPSPDYMLEDEPGEHLAVLQLAAQLNSLHPGAMRPDAQFIASLRERVMAACGEDDRR